MNVHVTPVQNGRQLRRFIRLPWGLHRDDPHWVAPLFVDERKRFDLDRNPFFEHAEARFLLALRGREPVGRLSAHIDHLHNEFHAEQTGFFGFFESVDDPQVAEALFDDACGWLHAKDMEQVRGPFNFNTNGESGLLIHGFDDPPALMMPYNPPHYPGLIERCGFRKAKDLLAYVVRLDDAFRAQMRDLLPRLEHISERARGQGYTARPLDLNDFAGEVTRLREIYNEAWEYNWGFVPLTEKEFEMQARELKKIVVPELSVMIERDDEPVGFGLTLPDFNQALKGANGRLFPWGFVKLLWRARTIDALRTLTLGVKKRHRARGVDALLYLELLRAGLSLPQYTRCECSWVLEDNHRMRQAIERFRGEVTKIYRVYERTLK